MAYIKGPMNEIEIEFLSNVPIKVKEAMQGDCTEYTQRRLLRALRLAMEHHSLLRKAVRKLRQHVAESKQAAV